MLKFVKKIMAAILLRKLTMRSIIGFGNYKDLRVQDLINLKRHKELLSIYYNLGGIDFAEEVKENCCITPEREIPKPGKDNTAYRYFVGEALYDIIERDKSYYKADYKLGFEVKHLNKAEKNAQVRANCIRQNKEKSKIGNRNRNQKR